MEAGAAQAIPLVVKVYDLRTTWQRTRSVQAKQEIHHLYSLFTTLER